MSLCNWISDCKNQFVSQGSIFFPKWTISPLIFINLLNKLGLVYEWSIWEKKSAWKNKNVSCRSYYKYISYSITLESFALFSIFKARRVFTIGEEGKTWNREGNLGPSIVSVIFYFFRKSEGNLVWR